MHFYGFIWVCVSTYKKAQCPIEEIQLKIIFKYLVKVRKELLALCWNLEYIKNPIVFPSFKACPPLKNINFLRKFRYISSFRRIEKLKKHATLMSFVIQADSRNRRKKRTLVIMGLTKRRLIWFHDSLDMNNCQVFVISMNMLLVIIFRIRWWL